MITTDRNIQRRLKILNRAGETSYMVENKLRSLVTVA